MTDPVTIGTLAASALAMAAEAVLKAGVGEAVKDAYKALKTQVAKWAGGDVEALEKTPTPGRQVVVAEAIDAADPIDRITVRDLAQALVVAMKSSPSIGVDIGRLDAVNVKLGAITVADGVGFRADEIRASGDFETGDIAVGPSGSKKKT